jgi:hypothetical protein
LEPTVQTEGVAEEEENIVKPDKCDFKPSRWAERGGE